MLRDGQRRVWRHRALAGTAARAVVAVGQWLGDDTFVAVSDATPNSRVHERYRLSTCSISAGARTDVSTVDGSREPPSFPTGEVDESWW